MEPKTGRRIVSKGEYAKVQGQRATAGVLAVGLGGMAAFCVFVALGNLFACLACCMGWWGDQSSNGAVLSLGLMLLFGAGAYAFGKLACDTMKAATNIDFGVPLTRANTADLPAPDSLVRASAEPIQAQEAVLLRAAAEEQQRHEEQLVRAADGPE